MSVRTSSAIAASSVSYFPLHLRRDLVRRAAHDLDRQNGEAALSFWKTTCRTLGADLLAQGCPEHEMRAQILDFQAAVQVELLEMHHEQLARG